MNQSKLFDAQQKDKQKYTEEFKDLQDQIDSSDKFINNIKNSFNVKLQKTVTKEELDKLHK